MLLRLKIWNGCELKSKNGIKKYLISNEKGMNESSFLKFLIWDCNFQIYSFLNFFLFLLFLLQNIPMDRLRCHFLVAPPLSNHFFHVLHYTNISVINITWFSHFQSFLCYFITTLHHWTKYKVCLEDPHFLNFIQRC